MLTVPPTPLFGRCETCGRALLRTERAVCEECARPIRYSPLYVRFCLHHFAEVESASPETRAALAREWHLILMRADGRVCLCGTFDAAVPEGAGSSANSRPPTEIAAADLLAAADQLPLHWKGTTEVFELLQERTAGEIADARRITVDGRPVTREMGQRVVTRFDAWHRQRVMSRLRAPGFRERPCDHAPECNVYVELGRILNGEPAAVELERAA